MDTFLHYKGLTAQQTSVEHQAGHIAEKGWR
jgi:hypothetical protein